MAGIRALQRRTAKLEKGAKPRQSPIVIIYGSFDKFVDETFAEIIAGKLSDEWHNILATLRWWEDGGVWAPAYAR